MLKIGENCPTGATVKSILGQSSRAVVYTTEDNQLRWNYAENDGVVPGELSSAVSRFDALMSEIKVFAPEKHKTECFTLLGKALFSSLNGDPSPAAVKNFDQVEAYLHRLAQQTTRTNFVLQCMVATLAYSTVVLAILHLGYFPHEVYAYCSVFGAIGACVSVMQRAKDIDIDWTLNGKSLFVQSSVRVSLGLLFGAIFALACKANFLFGAFNEVNEALYLLSIVAGFSERMIPELFSRLELPQQNAA